MSIQSSSLSGNYENRDIECQDALEVSLNAVITDAQQAGWGQRESMQALMNLIVGLQLSSDETDEGWLSPPKQAQF